MFLAAATGFITAFSLILAIGAQNIFVLRQGILKAHVFWLCLFCATSDAILIGAGIGGFSAIVGLWPFFPTVMAYGGAAFLVVYGAIRLRAAWIGDYDLALNGKSASLWATIAVAAALTWLNPHVYLDTLGLIGAISTKFKDPSIRMAYGIGAATASFTFFFSLGYGARLLAPILQSARAWRVLDILTGIIMWGIALELFTSAL